MPPIVDGKLLLRGCHNQCLLSHGLLHVLRRTGPWPSRRVSTDMQQVSARHSECIRASGQQSDPTGDSAIRRDRSGHQFKLWTSLRQHYHSHGDELSGADGWIDRCIRYRMDDHIDHPGIDAIDALRWNPPSGSGLHILQSTIYSTFRPVFSDRKRLFRRRLSNFGPPVSN